MTADPFAVDTTTVFDDTIVIDPDKDYWSELVGDGKKYKDPAAAGRALAEKDAFIARLQSETKGMRDELTQRKTAAEIFDQFKSLQSPPKDGNQPAEGDEPDKNSLTKEQLEQLIENRLNQRNSEATKQTNYNAVVETLTERFGDNAQRIVSQKAQELGVDPKFLKEMASEKPKVFLSLFDKVETSEAELFSGVAPKNQLNTTKAPTNTNGTRNKAYYDNIKKTDPNRYWSVSVQGQMHRDAIKLQEKFY